MTRFLGNCLIVAIVGAAVSRGHVRRARNRAGRWHYYWTDPNGLAFEFYGAGASQRSYSGNALYIGHVKRAPRLDELREGRAA